MDETRDVVTIDQDRYEQLIVAEENLRVVKDFILDNSRLSWDEEHLNIDSNNLMDVFKIIFTNDYKRKLVELQKIEQAKKEGNNESN